MVDAAASPYCRIVTSRSHATPESAPPLERTRERNPEWFIGWDTVTEEWVALPSSTAPRRDPPWVYAVDLAGLEGQLARG